MGLPKNKDSLNQYPYFYFDRENYFIEATNFMMSGEDIEIIFPLLVSDLGFYIYTKFYNGPQLGNTGFRYKKEYLQEMHFIKNIEIVEKIKKIISTWDFSKSSEGCSHELKIEKIYADFLGLTDREKKEIKDYKKNLIAL